MTLIYTDAAERQGGAWAGKAALPDQTLWQASLPTRLFQNRSIRVANAPAFALDAGRSTLRLSKTQGCSWLAKRGDVLGKHLQARLRVSFQNISGIRATNQP